MSQGRRERILDEAAQWMALLQSGHAGAEERLAFQQWRQADAEHGAVFDSGVPGFGASGAARATRRAGGAAKWMPAAEIAALGLAKRA